MDIDFDSIFTDTLSDIAAFIPDLIAFLLIFLIGWFIARWIRRGLSAVLRRIRFDEYIDRSGIGAPLERAGFSDSGQFIAMIVYYLIMLLVLKLALGSFGENDISTALDGLILFIPKLIVAIAIVIVTGLVANAVGNMIRPALAGTSSGHLLTTLATSAIWVIGIFAAIDQIGFARDIVDTLFTALVGSLGLIMVIKFGVGGIWAARDYFWPAVYRKLGAGGTTDQDQPKQNA